MLLLIVGGVDGSDVEGGDGLSLCGVAGTFLLLPSLYGDIIYPSFSLQNLSQSAKISIRNC